MTRDKNNEQSPENISIRRNDMYAHRSIKQNGGNISFEVQWRLDNDNRNRIVLPCGYTCANAVSVNKNNN